MATNIKNIGIAVTSVPKKASKETDKKSPFSASVKLRGRQLTGTVVSTKMRRSATVEWEYRRFVPKFERYEKRLSKIVVHVPGEIEVKEGDIVKIAECRPISKRKHFVIIDNLGQKKGYAVEKEGRDASKQTKKAEKPAESESTEEQEQ